MIRVWALWTDRSEVLADVGPADHVWTPEQAILDTTRRGLVCDYGRDPRWLGLHAVALRGAS